MFHTPAKLALKIALKSPARFKMGAVLAKGNRILSWGVNNSRHAEVNCICNYKRLNGTIPGTQLYVARVSKTKQCVGLARPCEECQRWIDNLLIDEVFYTTKMVKVEHDHDHRTKMATGWVALKEGGTYSLEKNP